MFDPNANESPINPLPWAVTLLVAVILGVELVFQAAERGFLTAPDALGWRLEAGRAFGFYDPLFDAMRQTGRWGEGLIRFLTYPFVHFSFVHALIAAVFVAALGKFVGEALGSLRMLVVFFAATIGAVLLYGFFWDDKGLVIGAYSGAYGLIGGYTYLMFTAFRARGENEWQAFRLIGFLMAFQLIWGLIFGSGTGWITDLLGFICGFASAILVTPDFAARISALRDRLQGR